MLGAIIGDVVGSRFEWNNIKSKKFKFFTKKCSPTDDSIMSLAIAKAILNSSPDYKDLSEKTVLYMRELGDKYPEAGYGNRFAYWLETSNPKPYNSFGNGSAMRISPVGFMAKTLDEVKELSKKVTEVTHNHEEGLKGAEATAVAIFLARNGKTIPEIKQYICDNYYKIDFTLDEIREDYDFDETCQGSVPQALEAFFESKSFEDTIRNAISIGGDSDTLAAIAGGIAEAYYGIPEEFRTEVLEFLDDELRSILLEFEDKFQPENPIKDEASLNTENVKKLVIFNGSFNPPTKGHLTTIVRAMDFVGAEKGIFIPVCFDYLSEKMRKEGKRPAFSDDIRLKMLEEMCKEDQRLSISKMEIESKDSTHTTQTALKIKELYPDYELYQILGSDKLKSIPHWNDSEELMQKIHHIVFSRKNDDVEKLINSKPLLKQYEDRIQIYQTDSNSQEDVSDISSSKVRDLFLEKNPDYKKYLVSGVAKIMDGFDPEDYPAEDFSDRIKALSETGRYGLQKAKKLVYEKNLEYFKENKIVPKTPTLYDSELSALANQNDYQTITGCIKQDVMQCAKTLKDKGYNPVILSTSSRIHACGDYHNGGENANEEEICRCSSLSLYLYQFENPKLKAVTDSGIKNLAYAYPLNLNFGAIYSPEVLFFRETRSLFYEEKLKENCFSCSVISMPSLCNQEKATDKTLIEERKYINSDGKFTKEGRDIMANKIRTIFRIALANGHDSLVLNDFGVKAYYLSGEENAKIFKQILSEEEFKNSFKLVAFAILEGKGNKRYPVEENGPVKDFYNNFGRLTI